jgi:diphosphomevalonate decarboxylase
MLSIRSPLKVVWAGEHAVPVCGGVVSSVGLYAQMHAAYDAGLDGLAFDGPDALRELFFEHCLSGAADDGAVDDGEAGEAAQLRRMPYRVRFECEARLVGMGLGTSSAFIATAVALLDALAGRPFDRGALFERTRAIEARAHPGASGIDAVGCVFGGHHYYHPTEQPTPVPLAHLPRACALAFTNAPHDASCAEPLSAAAIERVRALVARARGPPDAAAPREDERQRMRRVLREAHAVMREAGLSTPEADAAAERVGGKITGRGRGGCCFGLLGDEHALAVDGVAIVRNDLATGVPPHLRRGLRPLRAGMEASCTAASNIATCAKYWGKRQGELQQPENASASIALPDFATTTTVRVVAEGEPRPTVDARVDAFVRDTLGDALPADCGVAVISRNNFPTACGVASSASGFACLARCLARLVGREDDAAWIEEVARLGSGSAVRSAAAASSPLVSWRGRRAAAHPCALALEHMLVVMDPLPKRVSSSDGHALARTSPFYGVRCALADGHTADFLAACARGDFAVARALTEAEALSFHMLAATCDPPLRYVASWDFAERFVRFRNERRLEAMFSYDAGQNVHLLFTRAAREAVEGFVATQKHMYTMTRGVTARRYRAVVLSGKRYGGKSHLAARLQAAAAGGAQVVELSAELKRAYCAERGLDYERMRASREYKEQHRAAMVAFGEAAREADVFVWCRRAWERVAPFPTTLVIADARRPFEVEFFRTAVACVHARVACADDERARRGWVFDARVDAAETETALDATEPDLRVHSGADPAGVWEEALKQM